jgi:hypothetical protein
VSYSRGRGRSLSVTFNYIQGSFLRLPYARCWTTLPFPRVIDHLTEDVPSQNSAIFDPVAVRRMIDLHWRKLKFRFRKVAMGALDIVSLAILAILIVGALFLVLSNCRGHTRDDREEPPQSLGGRYQRRRMDRRAFAADMDAGVDCGVCASQDRRGCANHNQPGGDHRTRWGDWENLGACDDFAEQHSRSQLASQWTELGRSPSMVGSILVIVWVLVLRSMDQKRQLEDRKKAGLVTPGPASFETLKKTLGDISEQLAAVEKGYQQLARRIGGQR